MWRPFFFGEHLRLCPWSLALASSILVLGLESVCPRKGCPWPRIFFVSLALSLVSSTPPLLNNINDGKITCSIFLDLKKAFDSVDINILLKKLRHYGFRGPAFNLLKSYLTDRKICTKVECDISKLCKIEHGVPQGSVLGPLLFSRYVNDLPYVSNFETTLFADDTNLHISHNNIKILQSVVTNETKKIDTWMKLNKLTINYTKAAICLLLKNVQKWPISDCMLIITQLN